VDYDIVDHPCPKCGHEPTHVRHCQVIHCEDGYIDEHEDDAINFAPGEAYSVCQECRGTGIERWCPSCGHDLNISVPDSATTSADG